MIWIVLIIAIICGTIIEVSEAKKKSMPFGKTNIQQWVVGKNTAEIQDRLGTCYDKWNKRVFIPGKGHYQLYFKNGRVSCAKNLGW